MSVILIRSVMLYVLVIFAVRLMGKRQLGELQPSELVITILVSNIATLPIEDTDIPLLVGITPILALVCFEVLISWLSLHAPALRKLISGSPKIIIRGGKIDPQVLRELRFSVDDLMTAMRGQDIFDISEVQFAIVETTGSLSVMKKAAAENVKCSDIGLTPENNDPPQLIISDGKVLTAAIEKIGLTEKKLYAILSSAGLAAKRVFIMTADSSGNCFVSDRDGNSYFIKEKNNDKSKN